MSKWGITALTEKGRELLAKVISGGTGIEFVRAVIGDGDYTEEEQAEEALRQRTELKNPRNGYGFSLVRQERDTVFLKVALDNAEVDEEYYIREIGIFAREAESGEEPVLYSISLALFPDYFPDRSYRYTITHDFAITVDDKEAEVRMTEGMGAYALAEDLMEFMDETGAALDKKADKENPVFTGSFSQNRKPDTPIGEMSHVEGGLKYLTGAHGEIVGYELNEAGGAGAHAEGGGTIASGEYQHAGGKYNVEDTKNQYAEIIGGGAADNSRKNIRTLDWDGNAVYAGDVSATDNEGDKVSLISLKESVDGKANVNHGRHIPDICTLISDWNNAVTNGWYMGNNAANGPGGGWYFGIVIAHNSLWVYQEIYRFNIASDPFTQNQKYVRYMCAGTWGNWHNISAYLNELKKSVSDGKSLLASTITNQGVQTAADAAFSTMAGNINTVASNQYKSGRIYGNAESMKGNAVASDVLAGKTFTSKNAGVNKAGTIPTLSADTDSIDRVNTHHITDYLEISAFVVGDNRNYFCCRIPKNTYTGETGYISALASNFGNAVAANVLDGKKFTSEAGLKVSGSMRNYSGVDIPRIGDTANIQDVTTGQWSNSVGAGSTLRFKPDFAGYVDTDTTIGMQCYGLHPSVVKTGALIGGNGSPAKGALRGTYDKESSNPITASTVLSGKVGWVNGSKITGNMPNRGAVSASVGIGGTYTISAGYHNGGGKVYGPNPKKLKFMVGFGTYLTVPDDEIYRIMENYHTDYMKHANNDYQINHISGNTSDYTASVYKLGTMNIECRTSGNSYGGDFITSCGFKLSPGNYIAKMKIRVNRADSGSEYNINLSKVNTGEYPVKAFSIGRQKGLSANVISTHTLKFTVTEETTYAIGVDISSNTFISVYCLDIWKVE